MRAIGPLDVWPPTLRATIESSTANDRPLPRQGQTNPLRSRSIVDCTATEKHLQGIRRGLPPPNPLGQSTATTYGAPLALTRNNASVARAYMAMAELVAIVVAAFALVVFLTWMSGVGPFLPFVQSSGSMRAAAALAALVSTIALLVSRRTPRTGAALAIVVALLGACELIRYGLGVANPCWCDDMPAFVAWSARPPGPMTELAALAFVLLGVAGATTAVQRLIWLRDACLLGVIAISLAALASFGLILAGDSAALLKRLPASTAVIMLLLALAWFGIHPEAGLTRIMIADSLGGAFARRLILPTLLLPVLLTFVFKAAQDRLGLPESLVLSLAAVATGALVAEMILSVAVLLDRSEQERRVVHALREDASTDGLTRLTNRRAFDAALLDAFRDGATDGIALLMLDLDHFKRFNDSFGHQAGDEVLRTTGRLLRAAVRPEDVVARYGGEEFAILLTHDASAKARAVSERILAAFRTERWPLRRVTISIGAAIATAEDTTESLLRRADGALYRSKRLGRDRFTLDGEVESTAAAASGESSDPKSAAAAPPS